MPIRFLEELIETTDKALGGWLPGGGVANPLSDAVRPALDALPTAERDPSLRNYYADKAATNEQRANQLLDQRDQQLQETLDGGLGSYETAHALTTDARLLGVNSEIQAVGDGEAVTAERTSTRLPGESDRAFVKRSEQDREEWAEILEQNYGIGKEAGTREQSTTKGVSWAAAIDKSKGMPTNAGPSAGLLGCVYAVNQVIEASGREVPWKDPESGENSVYIPFVTNWIETNGGAEVGAENAKPGDIVVIGDGTHMGIVTDKVNGKGEPIVLSNSSSRATMSYEFPLVGGEEVYRVPQLQS